jgi:hypothetical protein
VSEQLRLNGFQAGGGSKHRGVEVTLNPVEVEVATVIGTARTRISLESGFRDKFHCEEEERLRQDVDAAGAELGGSKLTGCRWNMTVGSDLSEPDLFPNVEVRHTTLAHGGLIIRPRDKDGRLFFLVTGTMPTYCVVGWIRVEEARCDEYRWEDVWKVPQRDLREPPQP